MVNDSKGNRPDLILAAYIEVTLQKNDKTFSDIYSLTGYVGYEQKDFFYQDWHLLLKSL